MALDKNDIAQQQFNSVLQSANTTSHQYYQAQWYSFLLSVKANEIKKAEDMSGVIIHSSSPFKNKAAEILDELNAAK